MQTSVLIVEDQFIEASNLAMILEKAGYLVLPIAHSVHAALTIMSEQRPDLVLLDIYLQGTLTGIDLAHLLKERGIAFVYLSANSTEEILDAAKKTKPYGFLVKPFRERDVLVTLQIAHYLHDQRTERPATVKSKRGELQPAIVGTSTRITEVLEQIRLVSDTDASILITGESGTGKELVAQAIHNHSARNIHPFVRVNCAALPPTLIESELFGHEKGAFTGAISTNLGKFERAKNGTIFLDEIGEMPLIMQGKLLHVLQEREIERVGGNSTVKVNVRVIAATNRNLEKEIAAGRFRIDLYYRLNVFPISLPALRDRKEDIAALIDYFIQQASERIEKNVTGISNAAMEQLLGHDWPGNIRELQNIIERAVVKAQTGIISSVEIEKHDNTVQKLTASPAQLPGEIPLNLIWDAIVKCEGRISGKMGAAELLGMNASTLRLRIKKAGILKKTVFKNGI